MEKIKANGFHKWLTPLSNHFYKRLSKLGGDEPYPHLDPYNHYSFVSIHSYSEAEPGLLMRFSSPRLGTAKAPSG
jgi:hypothetical protein